MKSTWTVLSVCLWAGLASAQTAATDAAAACPAINDTLSADLRWEAFSTPDMLFCKAVAGDSGEEIFALTISRDSPFRPRRGNRAEVGTLAGRELQWYSGEIATAPAGIVRETLINTNDGRKAHIFMRATNAETIARRQRMVEMLDLARAPSDD